jgi:hypothetical protein
MKKWYYDSISSRRIGKQVGDYYQIWYGEKGFFKADILFRKTINGWKYISDGRKTIDGVKTLILKSFEFIGIYSDKKHEMIRSIYEV